MLNRLHVTVLCLVLSALMLGCSSGKTTAKQSGFVFTSPATAPTIDVGGSVTLTVNQSANWSLQPGSGLGKAVGQLSTMGPATSVTFSVPSGTNLANATQTTVVATLASDSTQNAVMIVSVNLPVAPLISSQSFLTSNPDCSYNLPTPSNDGTVGLPYTSTNTGPSGSIGVVDAIQGTPPYTWSVSPGFALPAGLILQSGTGTTCASGSGGCAFLSGTPITPGCTQVQLTVADSAGTSATTATYNVLIGPPALSVQVSNYSDLNQGVAYPPVAMSVSGGKPPYSWSLLDPVNLPLPPGMNLTVGTGTASAVLSGTPGLTTTALTPAFLVVDNQSPYPAVGHASYSFTETLGLLPACAPVLGALTSDVNIQGPYAFLLRGFDSSGPVIIAGSFTADGTSAGNVTAGEVDVMRSTGSQAGLAVQPSGSSYTIFEQQGDTSVFETRGCVTLATSAGTMSFTFSLGGCTVAAGNFGLCGPDSQGNPGLFTTGRLIDFDSGTHLTGVIRRQDSSSFSAGLSGAYAFGLSGQDASGNRFASAGSINASSSSISSGFADINDGGTTQLALTGGTGQASAPDSNGREIATLSVGNAAFNLVAYMVSANDAFLSTTGVPSASNPIASGEAVSTTGPFSASSLQNGHIFHINGMSAAGPDPSVGLFSFDGVGTYSGTEFEDQSGTLGTAALSGVYQIDPNSGRFVLSANSNTSNPHPLVGYVIPVPQSLVRQNCAPPGHPWNCVTGFLLSTDLTAQAGLLEFQTPNPTVQSFPPPFSNLYVQGYYFFGTDDTMDAATPVFEGEAFAFPTGNSFSGIQSASYSSTSIYCIMEPGCAELFPNQTIAAGGKYSVNSNGTGTVGGQTVAVTNGNVIFYIDESPVNSHPAIMVAEQQ